METHTTGYMQVVKNEEDPICPHCHRCKHCGQMQSIPFVPYQAWPNSIVPMPIFPTQPWVITC